MVYLPTFAGSLCGSMSLKEDTLHGILRLWARFNVRHRSFRPGTWDPCMAPTGLWAERPHLEASSNK